MANLTKIAQCPLELVPQAEPDDDFLFKSRSPPKKGPKVDLSKMTDDERFAWEIQNEEHRRYRMLHAQMAREMNAKKHNIFAEGQRVEYLHKATGHSYEAVILAVHLDDGFDKPYYTIRYTREEDIEKEDGTTSATLIDIDKQTTPDRINALPWDEDKAYASLKKAEKKPQEIF